MDQRGNIPQHLATAGRHDHAAASYGDASLDEGSGLSDIFGSVRRHIRLLGGIVGAAMVIAAVSVTQLTPRYTAQAMVLIEAQSGNASFASVVAGLPSDAASVQSEAYVLNSRNLASNPLFAP